MQAVKGTRTKPEERLRKAAWAFGLRYRIRSTLPGKPDLVFARSKLVVFVDGCFWHGCPKHSTMPATNKEFWRAKLSRNKKRDRTVNRQLALLGWTVLRFWQHDVNGKLDRCVETLLDVMKKVDT